MKVSSLNYYNPDTGWLLDVFLVIDCGDPGIPINGSTTGTSTTFGSVVTHTCDVGFMLDGADQRECILDDSSNGVWSEPLPTCTSKYNLLNSSVQRCAYEIFT